MNTETMPGILTGVMVITNHLDDANSNPTIVYANKHLLDHIKRPLSDIINRPPIDVITEWSPALINEIIECTRNNTDWIGNLTIRTKKSSEKMEFVITPIQDSSGSVIYYSCSTKIHQDCSKFIKPTKANCVDQFIADLLNFKKDFKSICDSTPSSILKLDLDGFITYRNNTTIAHFGIPHGANFISFIKDKDQKSKFIAYIAEKNISKEFNINLTLFISKSDRPFYTECKFKPILSASAEIIGFSVNLIDKSENYEIVKQFEALRGAK